MGFLCAQCFPWMPFIALSRCARFQVSTLRTHARKSQPDCWCRLLFRLNHFWVCLCQSSWKIIIAPNSSFWALTLDSDRHLWKYSSVIVPGRHRLAPVESRSNYLWLKPFPQVHLRELKFTQHIAIAYFQQLVRQKDSHSCYQVLCY